jgi:hypothetical protein
MAKKCKNCKTEIINPFSSTQTACSPSCAIELAREKQAKESKAKAKLERKAHRAAKERVKSKGKWFAETQAVFNKWIRLRDDKDPCISCNRYHEGQYHAGHYLSRGASPELRFDEFNTRKQCSACNLHLSGNQVKYRIQLIKKIGLEKVEWLEGPHEPKRYTIDDLKEIKQKYKDKIKGML